MQNIKNFDSHIKIAGNSKINIYFVMNNFMLKVETLRSQKLRLATLNL